MSNEVSSTEVVKVGASQDAETALQTYSFVNVTGDPEYDGMICKLCATVQDGEHKILDTYYGIGEIIQSYIDAQDSKTVSAALKKISQHVSEASYGRLSELGVESLRKALKLREMLTQDQLELAKAGCVSLRNLLPICKKDVSSEVRNVILLDVSEGKFNQTEIPAKVKEIHPPAEKKEGRGGARKKAETPLDFMERIQKEMGGLLTDMKENFRLHTATALGSEDQATKTEYTHQFEARAEQFEQLNEQWLANEKVAKAFLDE